MTCKSTPCVQDDELNNSDTPERAAKRAANNKIRGMKLLTKELRRKLPPLYSQEGKACVHNCFEDFLKTIEYRQNETRAEHSSNSAGTHERW